MTPSSRWSRPVVALAAGAVLALSISTAPIARAARSRVHHPSATTVFDVTDYGARGDGRTKDTAAIDRAIKACVEAGGGVVLFPKGTFLTGAIHLQSNVELRLEDEETTLLFSTDPADYPVVFTRWEATECYNFSPLIYARNADNIAITGLGTLDGQGRAWHPWHERARGTVQRLRAMGEKGTPVEQRRFGTVADALRPQMIQFISCRNVRIEGVFITGAPFWTIHPVYCENVTIRNVAVVTRGPNTDGVDPESCRNVLIEDCFFSTGDDCIAIKSGRDRDGRIIGRPCENVTVRHCLMMAGHGGVAIGSEMSGDVRHIRVEDCEMRGTDRAIRIKSQRGRGGVVEDVVVENVRARDNLRQAIEITLNYSKDMPPEPFSERTPVFRHLEFRNMICEGAPQAVSIDGIEESLIRDVRFQQVKITAKSGVSIDYGENITFENCSIEARSGPPFEITNSRNVSTGDHRP